MKLISTARHIFTTALVSIVAGAESPLAFEVASIHPSDPSKQVGIRRYPGGRFVTSNASLRLLITWAYGIGDERLVGAPGWLDSARFDIVAKAPTDEPTLDEQHAMMKSLLADRFKLRVHTATKELPMYTLVVDKGGPKLHMLEAPLAVNHDPFKMTRSGSLSGTSVTAAMLAKVLSNQVRHFVKDGTEFTGVFDFALEWRPNESSSALAGDDTRPSLATALQEQLGFRLLSGRSQVEVIAIDHVEKQPTEN